uniref:Uncharacterized protein n=1 Tax=Oryza punctata TaxID=4537 RepID=A0A0E0MDU9_ORYPU
MERRFLLLLVSLLLLTTDIAAGEQPPRRTAVAGHPAIVGRRLGTTTAAPCDPLCISGTAAGASPAAMVAAAMAGNESESALPPRQLDRPDGGLPTTHQSWIYYGPVPTTSYYSTAPPARSSLLRATAAAAVVFSTMLLVAAAASAS